MNVELTRRVVRQDEEIELLRNENSRLKRALAFWLPHVPKEDTARGDRIAADAYLLGCYGGPDEVDAETLGWIALTPNVELSGELHDECMVLRHAIRQTLDENGHLADGEVCALLPLKLALRKVGTPWDGEELHNVQSERLAEMFGIPKDALSATLRMRAGVPPILTVTRMIYRAGQLEPTRQHDKYRLVPVEARK